MSNDKRMTPEYAKKLNQLVHDHVGKNLWLISNFEEVPSAQSVDAQVLQKIQNMYLFTIDVGLFKALSCKIVKADRQKVIDLIDGIVRRRSVMDHNTSVENGTQGDRDWYNKWVREVIKKDEPTEKTDWEKLNNALCDIETRIIELYENFIFELDKNKERLEKTNKFWKEKIIEWYCRDAGKRAIVGNWERVYRANNPKEKIENSYIKLNEYAEKRIFEVFDAEEKCIDQCLEGIKSIRKIPSADGMKKLKQRREKNTENKEKRRQKLIEEMGGRSYKENNLYIEWYIMKVENEIYDILYKEMPDGVDSLLPQDVVQYICSKELFLVFSE